MESDQGPEGQTALRDWDEERQPVWPGWHLVELERPASGEWLRTFAIITGDANELVANIHNRMPLIVAPVDYRRWLSDEPDPHDPMKPVPRRPDAHVTDLDAREQAGER